MTETDIEKWCKRYPFLKESVLVVTPLVKKLRDNPSLEFEARFGRIVNYKFEPGVKRAMIDQVIEMMISSSHMTGNEWQEEQDFMYNDNGVNMRTRVAYCSETMSLKPTTIQKTNIDNASFFINNENEDNVFAMRISLKEELPVENSPSCVPTDMVRIKQRRRFVTADKCWAFDFAITWFGKTKSEAEHKQSTSDPIFEIECELLNPTQVLAIHDDARIATSLLLKMYQLLPDSLQQNTLFHFKKSLFQ